MSTIRDTGGKFPVSGHGQALNQGVVGDFTIEFAASGMVGTAYGYPGLSATRVGTGLYDIRFPKTAIRGARFYPQVRVGSPSGSSLHSAATAAPAQFSANMSHVAGESGVAHLNIVGPRVAGTGTVAFNAPTGAAVDVLVLSSPISRY